MAAALGLISFKNAIGLVIRARLFEKDERRTRVAAKKERWSKNKQSRW
jgi:hypothetical protein